MKTGLSISFSVEIKQNSNSINLLYLIQSYFNGVGHVGFSNKEKTVSRFKISNLKDILELVIPHFEQYPLLTSKYLNYLDFKKIILMIQAKEHLTESGIKEIQNIISNMNSKRSFKDKWEFSFKNSLNLKLNPYWVSAFADGEGNFNFVVREKSYLNAFSIYQNVHDFPLMFLFTNFFGCGNIYPLSLRLGKDFISAYKFFNERKTKGLNAVAHFVIGDRSSIFNSVLPFFEKYPLYTAKHLDFQDWKTLVNLTSLKNINSMSIEERDFILKISNNMNSRRNFSNFKEFNKIEDKDLD